MAEGAVDRELSRRAAEAIQAQPKECYHNAFRAWVSIPELWNALYVEGWAVDRHHICYSHGWLEMPDGRLVDPTLGQQEEFLYFPGLRFDHDTFLEWLGKGRHRNKVPLWEHFPYHAPELTEFRNAYGRAWSHGIPEDVLERWRKQFDNDG